MIPRQSFASLLETEKRCLPPILHNVNGAKEFAKLTEEYLQDSSQNTVFLTDVHGVITNYSEPGKQPQKTIFESRGDMASYLKKLIERKHLVLFSSAWSNPEEAFTCLSDLDLLSQKEEIQEGVHTIKIIHKYPPVTEQELENAAGDETSLALLKIRPAEETIEISRKFVKKGNAISVKSDETYYRSKAFAPDVYSRDKATSSPIDTLIFMEDSDLNIKIFLEQYPLTTYYPTLKRVIVFKFPGIQGEIREEDKIDPALL